MLIKQADDHTAEMVRLEQLAAAGKSEAAKIATKELRLRRAGIKGEAESAYQIDFYYAASPNWAVIHDLRLELNGRTAQIDHLLINRWMECFVLETKHFNAGIKITNDGEFLRWNDYKHTFEGMPSPLQQNERHIAVLRDAVDTLDLPTRMGMRIALSFQSFVLVSPTARIDRSKLFDSGRVLKADQLKERITQDVDKIGILKSAAKLVAGETVRDVAQQLVKLHHPVPWPLPVPVEASVPSAGPAVTPTASTGAQAAAAKAPAAVVKPIARVTEITADSDPCCKECHGHAGSIQHGKYGYYFQCAHCQANTAIKFTCQPGHKARLRKGGNQFYRDCAECHSSQLYFTNP
jgi:hypothetical protein